MMQPNLLHQISEFLLMTKLRLNAIYRIELCSGECRRWRYLGPDNSSQVWWRDVETGLEFNESSLMYAWQIVHEKDDPPAK
jgi:hypothetical protein